MEGVLVGDDLGCEDGAGRVLLAQQWVHAHRRLTLGQDVEAGDLGEAAEARQADRGAAGDQSRLWLEIQLKGGYLQV